MKKILLSGVCVVFPLQHALAVLQPLVNDDLTRVVGQGGANVQLDMRLNQTTAGPVDGSDASALAAAQNAVSICSPANPLTCRVGVAVKHADGVSDFWFTFKGVSGGIYIPKLGLDGSDVQFTNTTSGTSWQGALKLSFGTGLPEEKININNFGFQALSIDQHTDTGYRTDTAVYSGVDAFDDGKEKGIIGLNINGQVSVQGSIKMFACGANHPRCI